MFTGIVIMLSTFAALFTADKAIDRLAAGQTAAAVMWLTSAAFEAFIAYRAMRQMR